MTHWNDDETKAPACGRGFRAASSVGWMGGARSLPALPVASEAKGRVQIVRAYVGQGAGRDPPVTRLWQARESAPM